jgi:hypothetical protein
MVVIAVVAEGLPAALRPAGGADRGSAVRAFSNGWLAAANGIRLLGEFNLTARVSQVRGHGRQNGRPIECRAVVSDFREFTSGVGFGRFYASVGA